MEAHCPHQIKCEIGVNNDFLKHSLVKNSFLLFSSSYPSLNFFSVPHVCVPKNDNRTPATLQHPHHTVAKRVGDGRSYGGCYHTLKLYL